MCETVLLLNDNLLTMVSLRGNEKQRQQQELQRTEVGWCNSRMKLVFFGGMLINATILLGGRTLPQLQTPVIIHDSCAGVTLNTLHSPHISAPVCPYHQSIEHQWPSTSCSSSNRSMTAKSLGESMEVTRRNFKNSSAGPLEFQENHEKKTSYGWRNSYAYTEQADAWKAGAAEWLVEKFRIEQ